MRATSRCAALTLFALVALSPTSRLDAQRRVEVKKFQWDPVVVHIAAEAPRGVEVFMSVKTKFWGLTWIQADSMASWLPRLHDLASSSATVDSTPYVSGRDESRMRVVKGVVRGQKAYALQFIAPPSLGRIESWLSPAFLADLSKALEKGVAAARDLERSPGIASGPRIYEQWEVDSMPASTSELTFSTSGLNYMVRGTIAVGFVVDSTGHVVAPSVTIYDCRDPNLAKQMTREVAAWRFTPGMRVDQPVATRVHAALSLETDGSFTTGGDRVIPGGRP